MAFQSVAKRDQVTTVGKTPQAHHEVLAAGGQKLPLLANRDGAHGAA
jgi:hypothetical protein